MRAGNHSRELEFELTARRIPYIKYGGLRFIETAHVKDLIAVLRVSSNPHDELALYRLFKMHRHIGKAHARTLSRLLSAASRGGDAEGDQDSGGGLDFREQAGRTTVVAAAPDKARRGLAATLDRLADAAKTSALADRIVAGLDLLRPLIRAHYDDASLRMEDLDRLGQAAAASSNLDAFLTGLVLDPAGASTDYARSPHIDDDYLVLSTVHSAKGLEWDNVHLIHAADGAFPSDMALSDPDGLAEEARLFYVAVTRARNQLTIYHPHRMHPTIRSDRHVYTQRSRFLNDRACNALDTEHLERVPAAAAEPSPVGQQITIPPMSELFA
jgi:DNA helicase-2/ATP-dependent DNA helicase PcrA